MKKVLYIKAQGLGDMLGGIPFLVQQKELGNEVYQTFYDMRHINKGIDNLKDKEIQKKFKNTPMYGGRHHVLEQLKNDALVKDIITIPYGKWNIFTFLLKNLRRFDEVVIPIKTRPAQVLGFLLGKKTRCIFKGVNDNSQFKSVSNGEFGDKCPALSAFRQYTHFPSEPINLPERFAAIFPSIFERSMDIKERLSVMNYLTQEGYTIVLCGGEREVWFREAIKEEPIYTQIIDYLGKTSFSQMFYLYAHASLCISGNGGPMRVANLMNTNCINVHTVSSYLMEPPVDDITSFNLRPYDYPECQPCEDASSTRGKCHMESCVFYNTDREGECRKPLTAYLIIKHIKQILNGTILNSQGEGLQTI